MKCDTCKMQRACAELERIGKVPKHEKCRCYSPAKPITNYDILRAKSVEEMAEWLDRLIEHCNDGPCFNCFMQKACLTSMLDWLKQEAT